MQKTSPDLKSILFTIIFYFIFYSVFKKKTGLNKNILDTTMVLSIV